MTSTKETVLITSGNKEYTPGWVSQQLHTLKQLRPLRS